MRMEARNNTVLLVGTGPMAIEYTKVLTSMGCDFCVVGRGEDSAQKFKEETGKTAITGGIDDWLKKNAGFKTKAIVAVTVKELGNVTLSLLKRGFTSILVEKPGGLNPKQIQAVAKEAKVRKAKVYVAYNRRFYSSVQKAMEIIENDGGVTSFNFEFTEWSHVMSQLKNAEEALKYLFLNNSTHVVDLAFFLGGKPKKITPYIAGGLPWHPTASIFAGAGITEKGALFSYQANWESPGRWGAEILTRKHRLIFRPLEELHIQEIGSVAINKLEINNRLDKEFKPGLYREVESFLQNDLLNLCTIEEQSKNLLYYKKICPYA